MFAQFLSIFIIALSAKAFGNVEEPKINYDRTFTVQLPMRDGVKLNTRVVYPKKHQTGDKRITIVDRSPYGYDALILMIDLFLPYGKY